MPARIDPIPYLRFPKPDVAGALFLAKILRQRVPKSSCPSVRQAASILEDALVDLRTKWSQQSAPAPRDMRPHARRLGAAWNAIRDRLLAYETCPEGHADRDRARSIHDLLFPDGLEFIKGRFSHLHCQTERRLLMIDERGLAKDLSRLVGDHFLAMLRAAYQGAGDALGVNKAAVPVVVVSVAKPLRVLIEAISDYALQLIAFARLDPQECEAVLFALSPIDEYRASLARRSVADDEDDDASDPVVTPLSTPSPVVLARVA